MVDLIQTDEGGKPETRWTAPEVTEFAEDGQRMLEEWEAGVTTSLRG